MFRNSARRFCAFCRSERTIYPKKHISFVDVALTCVASGSLSFIIWQDLDPRATLFFAVGLGIAELFVVFRRRLSAACPHCGFDPFIYKKNPEMAAQLVKAHYSRRLDDPLSVFAPPPKLPVIVKKAPRGPVREAAVRVPARPQEAKASSRTGQRGAPR